MGIDEKGQEAGEESKSDRQVERNTNIMLGRVGKGRAPRLFFQSNESGRNMLYIMFGLALNSV